MNPVLSTGSTETQFESFQPSIFLHGSELFCGWCMCSFKCPTGLKIHVNVMHQPTCSCGTTFETSRSLFDHAQKSGCRLPFPYEWKHFDGSFPADNSNCGRTSMPSSMPSNGDVKVTSIDRAVVRKPIKHLKKNAVSKLSIRASDEEEPLKLEKSIKNEAVSCGDEIKTVVKSLSKTIYKAPDTDLGSVKAKVTNRKKSKWSVAEIGFLRSCFTTMIGGLLRCVLCSHVYAQWKTSYMHISLAHEAEFSRWKVENVKTLSQCSKIKPSSDQIKLLKKEIGGAAFPVKKYDAKVKPLKSVKKFAKNPKTFVSGMSSKISTDSFMSKQTENSDVPGVLSNDVPLNNKPAGTLCDGLPVSTDSPSSHTIKESGSGNEHNACVTAGSEMNIHCQTDVTRKHLKIHQPFKFCAVCCKTFDNLSFYMTHLKKKNQCADVFNYLKSQCKRLDNGRAECQICKETFPTPSRLYHHVRCKHDQPQILNKAMLINSNRAGDHHAGSKSGRRRWMIALQLKKAPNKKSLCCSTCHQSFNHRSTLYKHKVKCRKQLDEEGSLLQVKSESTAGESTESSFVADRMRLVSNNKSVSLQLNKSPKNKSLCCLICRRTFNSKSSLQKHRIVCRKRSVRKGTQLKVESDFAACEPTESSSTTCKLEREQKETSDAATVSQAQQSEKGHTQTVTSVAKLCHGPSVKSVEVNIACVAERPRILQTVKGLPRSTKNQALYSSCIELPVGFRCKFCGKIYGRRSRIYPHMRKCHAELVESLQNSLQFKKPEPRAEELEPRAEDLLAKPKSLISKLKKASTKSRVFSTKVRCRTCAKCGCSVKSYGITDKHCARCKVAEVQRLTALKQELSYLSSNCELQPGGQYRCKICGFVTKTWIVTKAIYKHIRKVHGVPDELQTLVNTCTK